ncbi:endo alpha-1,4 polygalactosaminidase precursor [Phlyctema vagabunda]|uniref:alpha-galactosidase n=1 Tax=Phlyctema vagabunda TaxID=108571 RepID=A0ABR4PHJ6_9HELO
MNRRSKYDSFVAEKPVQPRKNCVANLWQRHRTMFILSTIFTAVVIIGLPIGLALGLHDKHGSHKPVSDTSNLPGLSTLTTHNNTSNGTYWQPKAGTSWQIVLSTVLNDTSANVEVFDIDLFTNTAEKITELHKLGKKVICYFSAGSYENFRPDSSSFQTGDYGKGLDGWEGEWWVNTKSANVRAIMAARLDLAMAKGCDGVDPDNIDGYGNDTGLDLTEADAIDYLKFLATAAHTRGMAIGLKNGGTIVTRIIDVMDWEINEQCLQFTECAELAPFIAANKPVFHIEYPSDAPVISSTTQAKLCNTPSTSGFSTLLKKMNLDEWVLECPIVQ